jgi:hypothetical protein
MGVSIYWRPVSTEGHDITPGLRSRFYNSLKNTFGEFPIRLNATHVCLLQAMAYACNGDDSQKSYEELIEAVNKHDEIEIFASW